MMTVTVAKSAGFCFGVRRAVGMAYAEAEKKKSGVYTLGPLIHNESVVDDLASRGIRIVDEDLFCAEENQTIPAGSTVIVRSHGISEELHQKLHHGGFHVVDATCPFVRKIHDVVKAKSLAGMPVVIIGNPDHPEVHGIQGWVHGESVVIEKPEDIHKISYPKDVEVCVIAQTTFNFHKFQELVEIIKSLGYHVNVTNTICNATKERQEEALLLAGSSDIMIVIGGKASSNTRKLYEICLSRCPATYFVQSPDDLKSVRFTNDCCVGITAGASTPNTIIQEVSLDVRRTEF